MFVERATQTNWPSRRRSRSLIARHASLSDTVPKRSRLLRRTVKNPLKIGLAVGPWLSTFDRTKRIERRPSGQYREYAMREASFELPRVIAITIGQHSRVSEVHDRCLGTVTTLLGIG